MKWTGRKAVQRAHEQFTLKVFLKWFNNQHRSQFKIIEEPNPPEAIIRSGRTVRWVEVTAVYWNDAYARDLCSYATEGEEHRSIDGEVFVNSSSEFLVRFSSVLKKKLEKRSYVPYRDQYGAGYLLVSIEYPWFDKSTLISMKSVWAAKSSWTDLNCFRSAYLVHRIKFRPGYYVTKL